MKTIVVLAGLAAASFAVSARAEDGKALFASRCAACHAPDAVKSGPVAPRIKGVVGRKIASLPDYSYSAGLKAKAGQSWTEASLDTYLTAPAKFAPGTKMFVALTTPAERKAVVGYLKTLK